MIYRYGQVLQKDKHRIRLSLLALSYLLTLLFWVAVGAYAAKPSDEEKSLVKTPNVAGSLGKVTFDTNVFSSSDDEMDYGDGIPNGEWVVAEMQGVKLGARITDRKDGLIDVVGERGNRLGVYYARTGYDVDPGFAEWNYEWSVDLTNAKGLAANKTLNDYALFIEQDFTQEHGEGPVDLALLPFPLGACDVYTELVCQQSWNPTFFNTDFDPLKEGTYNIRFVLTPKSFNGPSVAVAVKVIVTAE